MVKVAPAPGALCQRIVAAVLLDDLPRDGEAEARALRLGGEELLEQAPADLGRDAGARVRDGDLHRVAHAGGWSSVSLPPRDSASIPFFTRFSTAWRSSVRSISIGGTVGIRRHLHRDALARGERPHELRDRADHVVDRVLLELRPREAREGQVLLGERVEGAHLVADRGDERGRLLHVRAAAPLHDVAQQLGVQLDGRDGVAHLVRDLERQPADRGHALGHDQLLPGRPAAG